MSTPMLHPSLVLASPEPLADPGDALATRVRVVLETRPGRLPWRPDFGCDLAALVGQPMSGATQALARQRVEAAVRRWVPDAELVRCEVRLVSRMGAGSRASGPDIPAAEAALMRLGAQGWLEVELELRADTGSVHLSTTVAP